MANYLITGGCGFIGSHLSNQLIEAGHQVMIVDNVSTGAIIHPKAIFHQLDIATSDRLDELFMGIDGCFHLAAVSRLNLDLNTWSIRHASNVAGSFNVFKAAIWAGNIPVVYASTYKVYGQSDGLALNETQRCQPLCAFGCDSLANESNAYYLAKNYQLPSMGLRLFNVYGPYLDDTSFYAGVMHTFIHQLLNKKPLTLFGDGEQTRDFIFIDDVIQGFIHAMNHLKHGAHVVNLCSGQKTSINQLVRDLSQALNQQGVINRQPARFSDMQDAFGSQTVMNKLGFKFNVNLREGIKKTITHFLSPPLKRHPIIKVDKTHWIQHNLDRALEEQQLYVCYQPQIEINSKRVIGFEALLHWRNKELGQIGPSEFIPIAEQSQHIQMLGDWVLRMSCVQAATWPKRKQALHVSVNVSVRQLQDSHDVANQHFVANVQHALTQAGLRPQQLELEITESILMQMNPDTIRNIHQLKQLGVRLSCDDFGKGYASFCRLVQLPLDTLKIDQSLIAIIENNSSKVCSIVRSITSMARELNIRTVAEGVETKQQVDALQQLGCDVIQGNYFSRPVRAHELNALLTRVF